MTILQTIYGIEALADAEHLGILADVFNTKEKKAQIQFALESLKRIRDEDKITKAIAKLEQVWAKIQNGEAYTTKKELNVHV
jgi:hypothetical protein